MAYQPPSSRRALAALAALRLSKSELYDLIELFRSGPTSYVRSLISDLEHQMLEVDIYEKVDDRNATAEDSLSAELKIADQIYQQLKIELKINNNDIVSYFTEMLQSERTKVTLPEFDTKRGLTRWLVEITRIFGPSRTLQISARIRNAIVHAKRPSWSVRGEDEFL